MDIKKGDIVTSSWWSLNAHAGTHADMPAHDLADGHDADSAPLAPYLGPCIVVEIGDVGTEIRRSYLETIPAIGEHRRAIFRTENSRRDLWARSDFATDYVSLHPDGAAYLVELGYLLAGIDYQGIERFDTPDRATHRTLLQNGCVILEGTDLRTISPGEYLLLCLPLRLVNGEASPVRAILIEGASSGIDAADAMEVT